jgi:hypothetical protein
MSRKKCICRARPDEKFSDRVAMDERLCVVVDKIGARVMRLGAVAIVLLGVERTLENVAGVLARVGLRSFANSL